MAPTTSSALGQRIGHAAERIANARGTVGRCYAGVADAVDSVAPGVGLYGRSAYMAADQLARSDKFGEVQVRPSDLPNLPRGTIVVWGQTAPSPHGHISVALGDGREASDHVAQQMTSLRGHTNVRVFIPR